MSIIGYANYRCRLNNYSKEVSSNNGMRSQSGAGKHYAATRCNTILHTTSGDTVTV